LNVTAVVARNERRERIMYRTRRPQSYLGVAITSVIAYAHSWS
jgi:hypothetical protein